MEMKLLCQPECQFPSVTPVPLAGKEAGARSPGEATTDALVGTGQGVMEFSEALLHLWHGAGPCYPHPHFLLRSTPRRKAVITLPS